MAKDLLRLVQTYLVPTVAQDRMQILSHEESDSFDNAFVILEWRGVRVRVLRERSQVFVDFGSSVEPAVWFDSAVVMEYLGLSETAGWHDRDGAVVLKGLADFLRTFASELAARFNPANFTVAKQELTRVRKDQAARRFG